MRHTLVAVFESRSSAKSAVDELVKSGFAAKDIQLNDDAGDSIADNAHAGHEGLGSTIKHYFQNLFHVHKEHHNATYETAVGQGHHVLTVTSASEAEIDRAADIVETFGPADIDEKAAEWASLPRVADTGAIRMRPAYGGPVIPALHLHGDRGLFAQQSLNDEAPKGYTYQETMSGDKLDLPLAGSRQGSAYAGSMQRDTNMGGDSYAAGPATPAQPAAPSRAVQRGHVRIFSQDDGAPAAAAVAPTALDDDTYFHNHWIKNYGNTGEPYDDYALAYTYGREMAMSYPGQLWDDVESDLRDKWDVRYPADAQSNWEKFKAAIRHGWDRVAR